MGKSVSFHHLICESSLVHYLLASYYIGNFVELLKLRNRASTSETIGKRQKVGAKSILPLMRHENPEWCCKTPEKL